MLLQFSIKNFKTFKEKASLSLIASGYDKDIREADNIYADQKFGLRFLKSAVIYGANASGKSKLLEAFDFMKDFVANSSKESRKGEEIKVDPFRLSTETRNEPSEFEVVFLLQDVLYRYGFEATPQKIVSEWLYHKPKTKEVELFFRKENKFDIHERNFAKGKTVTAEGMVRDNALLLSVAAQFNDKVSMMLLNWFKGLNIISGLSDHEIRNNTSDKIQSGKDRIKILEFLQAADLGIQDIQYEEFDSEFKGYLKKIKKGDVELENEVYERRERWRSFDRHAFSDISTIHNVYDSNNKIATKENFSVSQDESNGTQKFLYVSGTIIDVLEKGGVLIADELDSRLHPNLVCKIVALFNSKELNKKNAQLIFNTHDTNLLSSDLFRRDQIWFTEKDKYGAAKLYSLSDFKSDKVRKTDSFEENYLRGKYGAIPYLGSFDNLENVLPQHENEKQEG